MNSVSLGRQLTLACAIASIVVAAGCTGSDKITTTHGALLLRVEPSTPGTGRYESARFSMGRLVVRLADPQGGVLTGSSAIALTNAAVVGDLAAGSTSSENSTGLPPGRYRVDVLSISAPALNDSTNPLPPATTCIENFAAIPAAGAPGIPAISFDASELTGPEWEFTVSPGAQNLSLGVDAPAFIRLVETSYICDESSGTATLTGFNSTAYRNGLLPLLSIRK